LATVYDKVWQYTQEDEKRYNKEWLKLFEEIKEKGSGIWITKTKKSKMKYSK
jgi:endonuclease YncB( thermonuclease family)